MNFLHYLHPSWWVLFPPGIRRLCARAAIHPPPERTLWGGKAGTALIEFVLLKWHMLPEEKELFAVKLASWCSAKGKPYHSKYTNLNYSFLLAWGNRFTWHTYAYTFPCCSNTHWIRHFQAQLQLQELLLLTVLSVLMSDCPFSWRKDTCLGCGEELCSERRGSLSCSARWNGNKRPGYHLRLLMNWNISVYRSSLMYN